MGLMMDSGLGVVVRYVIVASGLLGGESIVGVVIALATVVAGLLGYLVG